MRRTTVALLASAACCCFATDESEAALPGWRSAAAAAEKADASTSPFMPPISMEDWYTVTIGDVPVGYLQQVVAEPEPGRVHTKELMDVQVSRGADNSRMGFETVFVEHELEASAPFSAGEYARSGAVTEMAYDQRFANSVIRMSASLSNEGWKLTSFNGENEHVTDIELEDDAR